MKKIIIGLAVLSLGFLNAQNVRYFKEDNIALSKQEFKEEAQKVDKLVIEISTAEGVQKKVINRNISGELTNKESFFESLDKGLDQKINRNKSLVIIYHSGENKQDNKRSNRGSLTLEKTNRIANYSSYLASKLDKISANDVVYIYKTKKGIEDYKGIINYQKDPKGAVEKEFFPEHYPGGSFVVISPKGKYEGYLGKYPKSYISKALKSVSSK